jgi:hypothetical protein
MTARRWVLASVKATYEPIRHSRSVFQAVHWWDGILNFTWSSAPNRDPWSMTKQYGSLSHTKHRLTVCQANKMLPAIERTSGEQETSRGAHWNGSAFNVTPQTFCVRIQSNHSDQTASQQLQTDTLKCVTRLQDDNDRIRLKCDVYE